MTTLLPLIAMVLFIAMALLVALYVLTDRRRRHLRRMAALPLDDGVAAAPEESGHG